MLKQAKISEDKEVLRAIFDEVFISKTITNKMTDDMEHPITKALLKNKYFNKDVRSICIRITKYIRNDDDFKEGFILRVQENINGKYFTTNIFFSKERICELLSFISGDK